MTVIFSWTFLKINLEINFGGGFQFSNCHRLDNEYQVFAIFCEKCHYNVVGFARNDFASMNFLLCSVEKVKLCKHCKQLCIALIYRVRKVCIKVKDVPAEFKLEEIWLKMSSRPHILLSSTF